MSNRGLWATACAVALTATAVCGVSGSAAAAVERVSASDPVTAAQATTAAAAIAATPSGTGFWTASADGVVTAHGTAVHHGDLRGVPLNGPIVSMASTATGLGYWLVASDGGIFAFGDAPFHGSTGDMVLNRPVVGIAPTTSGAGYWMVATDGGIFAFGDAPFHGSMGAVAINAPVQGILTSATGEGYRMVAADGGVFSFGDAPFLGSTGDAPPSAAIVGLAPTPEGTGYWAVTEEGQTFAFGDATPIGDVGPGVVGITANPEEPGCRVLYADGSTRSFGAGVAGTDPTPPSRSTTTDTTSTTGDPAPNTGTRPPATEPEPTGPAPTTVPPADGTTTTVPPTTTTVPPTTTTTVPPTTTTVPPTTTTVPPTTTTVPPTTTTVPPTTTTVPPTTTTTTTPPPPAQVAAGTVVGSRSYAVPSGAIVVSPGGSDSAAGTSAAPLRTVTQAISRASSGATIVLRAGTYHESLTIPSGKSLTIQAWPGEAVWLDGSTRVDGWVADGGDWRHDGWTTEFDASPTYTRGAPDGDTPNWTMVSPSYPMAAHPDQLWVDGVAMRQVSSRGDVTPGTFFHDEAANRLYLGTNPGGAEVRASDLVREIRVRGDNSVLRGFGIRRFAPSVPDMGAVTIERPGVRVEHVAIEESATTGLSVLAANVVLRNVEVSDSGMLGIHGNHSDGLLVENVLSAGNNVERFNSSPVSGGMKITRARDLTVRDSVFRDNRGPGLWFDESAWNIVVVGSEMRDNSGHGTSLELSGRAVFVGNVVAGNSGNGLKVNNISDVRIWNNTFVGNSRNILIAQDDRRYGDGSPGKDPRYPNDPDMTWVVGPVELMNNVIANPMSGAPCLLCTGGYEPASTFGLTGAGNVYNRPSTASPDVVVLWKTARTSDARYRDLTAFVNATGIDAGSTLVNGSAVVTSAGVPTSAMPSSSMARPLPSDLAALTGRATGSRQIGAW